MAKAAKKATKKPAPKKSPPQKSPPEKPAAKKPAPRKPAAKTKSAAPKLLSGGNPQIAKGHGEEPVQAYIAAMPGWKRAAGERLDALVTRAVPNVQKAVKWNSPLYGMDGKTWFLGVHCFERYIKLAFFKGAHLSPPPPVASKQKEVRYFHLHEGDVLDEKQLGEWLKQASRIPGERM